MILMRVQKTSTKSLRLYLIMGVYLSEPNKDKHFAEGSTTGFSFVSAEMQGSHFLMKVGEKTWKTPPSTILTLETVMLSLQFLMVTEVVLLLYRV